MDGGLLYPFMVSTTDGAIGLILAPILYSTNLHVQRLSKETKSMLIDIVMARKGAY